MRRSPKVRVLACVAALTVVAGAAALAACSSDGSPPATGSRTTPAVDASLPATGGGIVLDAAPTVPDVAAPPADAGSSVDAAKPACLLPLPTDPCGLDPQCGCGAGETCDVADLDGGTTCVAAGTAPAGHACLTTASCAAGLTCLGGACRAYCTRGGDAGCVDAGAGPCVGVSNGDPDGGTIPYDDVCTFACDLTDTSACGSTGSLVAGCVVNGDGTDCSSAGVVGVGGDCSSALCRPGLTCVTFQGNSSQSLCKSWCHVGASPDDCVGDDAGTCQAFTTVVVANGSQYGFCP